MSGLKQGAKNKKKQISAVREYDNTDLWSHTHIHIYVRIYIICTKHAHAYIIYIYIHSFI